MLSGKGIWIYEIGSCQGGDPDAIAHQAQQAGLTHVTVKVADGTTSSNDPNLKLALCCSLQQAGIQCWGWQYVYGNHPDQEAQRALAEMNALTLDGFIVDAEIEYYSKNAAAVSYMAQLKAGLQGTPLGFSSFKFPSEHPQLPWSEFISACDYAMPQVYWEGSLDSAAQLQQSVQEYQAYGPPAIVPTGSAYSTATWRAQPGEIAAFCDQAKTLGVTAVNFWDWQFAASPALSSLWTAIASYGW